MAASGSFGVHARGREGYFVSDDERIRPCEEDKTNSRRWCMIKRRRPS